MAGLVPAIHVDPRDKPGDDELEIDQAEIKRAPPAPFLALIGGLGYFFAEPRAELRPVPRPRPIFLANSERCAAYFGATIG